MMNFDWNGLYEGINADFKHRETKPVIGITGNYDIDSKTSKLAAGYYQSVLKAGGIPVIIPTSVPTEKGEELTDLLDRLDGIILSGGSDMNPLFVGEQPIRELHSNNPERDIQELLLVKLAYDRQIPMLGICKGIQMINAALGGTLYQDIYSQMKGEHIKHSQDQARSYPSHTVKIEKDSILYKLFDSEEIPVNSFHHQACKEPAPCLKVTAMSTDGVIEAVESNEYKSILGVQWHPEPYILRGSDEMLPIFEWLVGESKEFKAAKKLHNRILTLDSHCDTPMVLGPLTPKGGSHPDGDRQESSWGKVFASRACPPPLGAGGPLVDLHKMTEGHLDSTIMVAYLQQNERDEASLENATAKANRILTQIEEMVAKNCTTVDIAYTPSDLWRLKAQGKHAIMLGIENGYAIGKDIGNVEAFRKRGVVYMTLCHNGDNDICDSARHHVNTCHPLDSSYDPASGKGEHGGVSEFGAKVIKEMNRVGMMVDLSHASEESFYDALEISSLPIVCSHSSAKALCDHPRNLTDDQMKALAKAGGVAQVTMYHGFLLKDSPEFLHGQMLPDEATILTAIEHLNHMVNVMGIEHVGIGTDFDGDGGIRGCANASELINFTRRLMRERYSEEQIQMIWGGNFLRVMEQVQRASLKN